MLNRLPRALPPLTMMLADLGHPPPAAVARALGVSARSVQRWSAADAAPRPVLLSLFWLTRWGMSLADAEVYNALQLHAGRAAVLIDQVQQLELQLARVLQLADFGSANGPVFTAAPRRPIAASSTHEGPAAGR